MPLPTPREVQDECKEILHYTSKADFEKVGGRTRDPLANPRYTDYVVSAAPATYQQEEGVEGPMDAIEAYWELFTEGGWTVFVWDKIKGEGWAYQYVGPDWVRYLYECMGRQQPSVPGPGPSSDPNLLHQVNRYRRSLGQSRDLEPGEWSDAELREFLSHAPPIFHNPLKQRLMPPG